MRLLCLCHAPLSHGGFSVLFSEVFLSDQASNLFALDSRTGRVLYGYQGRQTSSCPASLPVGSNQMFCHNGSLLGISGTITSLACAPHYVGSTSLDRFFRLHGTASEASSKNNKGQTLEKVYTKSIPTVVVWDSLYEDSQSYIPEGDDEGEGDRVWEGMEQADDDGGSHEDNEDEGDLDDEPSTNSLRKKSRTGLHRLSQSR